MSAAAPPALPGAATDCFHCGLPIPGGTAFGFESGGRWRAFCCTGCEAVSRAISGGGLDDYYRLREASAPRPVPDREDAEELRLYDEPALQQRFAREVGGGEREASVLVDGMRCTACAWLVEQVAERVPGVVSAKTHFASHRALVRWDPSRAKLADVLAAIRSYGYAAWPFEPGRLAALESRERRAMLRRLWVAGLGMMQVMMYAVPGYIAASGEIALDQQRLMDWAALVLTLPVLAYSASPFFAGAWRSLRNRSLGMDVPVALGIASAFVASAAATWRGSGAVYFDSIAMFVFLLTGGRYLEHLARSRAGEGLRRLERFVPKVAHRLDGAGLDGTTVPAALLAAGDRVLVRTGEALPADGVLEADEARLDESLLTGESRAVRRRRGEPVLAGAVNAGDAFAMRVERVGAGTTLANIERLMERALAERPRWVEMAERASGVFVAGVLLAALAAALAWITIDPARAPWIAISVLIVTCPCALSLAAPAAATVAVGEMARFGFVASRGHAIEALAGATDVVFDKTGTLTAGRPRLLEVLAFDRTREEALAIAAAMGRGSSHPLDRALAEAQADASGALPALESHETHPGHGAEARIAGRRYRIGQAAFAGALHGKPAPVAWLHAADTVAWLAGEEGWIAAFRIGDRVRPEAAEAVAALRALALEVHLLTGDEPRVASRVAAELGIGRVQARATPGDKQEYVRRLQREGRRVAMVGDGVNDAPVLGAADVSIAMGEGADLAQLRADAVLASGSIADLSRALRLARRTRRILRENLAWALAYNAVVLPLAFAGMVTPLLAGIGMASSSLLVVANALRLRMRGD